MNPKSKVPKDLKLPKNCCDAVIRGSTDYRVSSTASVELSRVLEKIGGKISIVAMELATHRGGVTITEKDIRLAVESMKLF